MMAADDLRSGGLGERGASLWDRMRSSFGFLSGVAMALGLVLGFALPAIDSLLDVELPVFDFTTQDTGRGLLETVATTTVAVAGLSFSVTVVAFTLASSQLSPRVLRTFSSDRLSQATLGCFLGTFIYCLSVLVRLGSAEDGSPVPNLSITLAIVLAIVSFGLFAAFIAHVVRMLQPSSIIEGVRDTAREALERPFPSGAGEDPEDVAAAERDVRRRMEERSPRAVHAEREGYVATLRGAGLVGTAAARDALVVQRVRVGEFVTEGTKLADAWCAEDDADELCDAVRSAFELQSQRTAVQDPAFPIRQLADIALKGLSPGINDPTTAENAMDSLAAALIADAAAGRPSPLRADAEGVVRLVSDAPDLDDLVRLGFEQVRVFAAPYPVVARHLIALLGRIDDAARRHGAVCGEAARQAALLAEGPDGAVPTRADVASVRQAYAENAERRRAVAVGRWEDPRLP